MIRQQLWKKKTPLNVLYFLIFFILIDNVVATCLGKCGYMELATQLRKEVYQVKEPVDILFVGSSHILDGVDTAIFIENNFVAHKLYTPNGISSDSFELLKIFLKRNPKPKLVVVDISYQQFLRKQSAEPFRFLHPWEAFPFFLKSFDEIGIFLNSLGRTALFFNYIIQNKEAVKPRASFSPSLNMWRAASLTLALEGEINKKELLVSERLLQYLKTLKIPSVVIDMPIYMYANSKSSLIPMIDEHRADCSSSLREAVFSLTIKDIVSNLDIPLIGFDTEESRLVRKEFSLFRDQEHLNSRGAKLFSSIMMDHLNRVTGRLNN